jgi:rhodanese-related sulfurtransferase
MTRTTIDVEALRDLLDRGQHVTVLDIRRSAERAEWAIPGSVHVEAYDALKAGEPNALDGVDLPEGAPVVTVCGAGKTSAIAAEQLRDRGLQVVSLEGGMKHSLRYLLELPPETLILPGHTSEPVTFDEEPVSGKIAEVREGVEALGASEDDFVERILEHLPPAPSSHRIVELNETGGLPEEELIELEAGANRCAAS